MYRTVIENCKLLELPLKLEREFSSIRLPHFFEFHLSGNLLMFYVLTSLELLQKFGLRRNPIIHYTLGKHLRVLFLDVIKGGHFL